MNNIIWKTPTGISVSSLLPNSDYIKDAEKIKALNPTWEVLAYNYNIPDEYWEFQSSWVWKNDQLAFDNKEQVKSLAESKGNEIRQKFENSCILPITFNEIEWHGGFDSALKLNMALELSKALNNTSVTFYDTSNVGHELSHSDALQIVIAIGVDFQEKLAKKQSLLNQLAKAKSKTAIEKISW